jgi:hypothetical protein
MIKEDEKFIPVSCNLGVKTIIALRTTIDALCHILIHLVHRQSTHELFDSSIALLLAYTKGIQEEPV